MAEILYRAATSEDVEALARLRWEMEAERHSERQEAMTLEDYTTLYATTLGADLQRGTYRAWLAFAGEQPVACAALIWWAMAPTPGKPHRKRGIVSGVFTRAAYRRQGISRHLMELVLANARDEGVERLVLWASDMGRPLYQSLGFGQSRGLELNFSY